MRSRWVIGVLAAGALATGACSSDDPDAPPPTPTGSTSETLTTVHGATAPLPPASTAAAGGPTAAAGGSTVAAPTTTTVDPAGTTPRTLGAINGPAVVETTAAP